MVNSRSTCRIASSTSRSVQAWRTAHHGPSSRPRAFGLKSPVLWLRRPKNSPIWLKAARGRCQPHGQHPRLADAAGLAVVDCRAWGSSPKTLQTAFLDVGQADDAGGMPDHVSQGLFGQGHGNLRPASPLPAA